MPAGLGKLPTSGSRNCGGRPGLARQGTMHPDVKVLRGFGGAGVLEVREQHSGAAYRLVYTTKYPGVVYALHAFKKKSVRGIATPTKEMDKFRNRLKEAERLFKDRKI